MDLNPHQQAEKMMSLSEEQSRLGEEATTLEIAEALYLNEFRANHASDKAVQSAWKVTEKGQRQIRVVNRLKDIKSELSVIKNYLRHAENSARNIY